MSFADLKRNRGSLDKLKTAMADADSGGSKTKSYVDERFWKPEMDKSGNGFAVVRFLPSPAGEEQPWVTYWDHGFQGPGGWFIEKSLTTLGKNDPVSEYNTQLWNSGIEANKDQARKQKRRLHYVSNILVVSDPKHTENEGKVFLYRYGKKIFEMLKEAMCPAFEDETPLNPFDFWEGANFKIKLRKVDGFWNYDKSEFDPVTPLFDGDDTSLEELYSKQYSLNSVIAPAEFKSYDELKEKLDRVLGTAVSGATAESVAQDADLDSASAPDLPWNTADESPSATAEVAPSASSDDDMDYFQRLANDS